MYMGGKSFPIMCVPYLALLSESVPDLTLNIQKFNWTFYITSYKKSLECLGKGSTPSFVCDVYICITEN